MTTQTHTPGPWAVRHTDNGLRIVYSDGELRSHVADLHSMSLCEEHGSLRANASLIAAAPDLLSALSNILEDHKRMFPEAHPNSTISWEECEEVKAALSAIAKAEGRAE